MRGLLDTIVAARRAQAEAFVRNYIKSMGLEEQAESARRVGPVQVTEVCARPSGKPLGLSRPA